MIIALGVALSLAVAVPHALRLERSPPLAAATIWMSVLVLRALTATFVASYVVFALPTTRLFDAITHWCWHAVLPVLTTHVGLHGHQLADVAVVLPALLVAASLVSIFFALWRASRAVGRLMQRANVGEGPRNSLIVGDGEVLVAAAGLRHPRLLVSAGALVSLDDEELEASLEHEEGHIVRKHRYVLVVAELCRALGRFLPGTRTAARELRIHLERDADRFAMQRRHAPVALASAICKAAQGPTAVPVTALGGGGVTRRVHELLEDQRRQSRSRSLSVQLLATAMVSLVVALSVAVPAITLAAMKEGDTPTIVRHCVD